MKQQTKKRCFFPIKHLEGKHTCPGSCPTLQQFLLAPMTSRLQATQHVAPAPGPKASHEGCRSCYTQLQVYISPTLSLQKTQPYKYLICVQFLEAGLSLAT